MNKALFLDRDGVINIEKNYVYRIEDFEFTEGIFEVLYLYQSLGYLLIVITNQAGIGRAYYSEEQFHILNNWMLDQFNERNIRITKVYFCPYHPSNGIGDYKREGYNRKPNPGMILQAKQDYSIDLSQSILIGDKESDIEAGIKGGVKTNILLKNNDFKIVRTNANIVLMDILELLKLNNA